MTFRPAEQKVVAMVQGGVRLALRLSQVREILSVPPEGAELEVRGERLPILPVAVPLGLDSGPARWGLVIEGTPPVALRVEVVAGIFDVGEGEAFQLPARTLLPQPPPFSGALVRNGEVALELAVSALGWAPIGPVDDPPGPPVELDFPLGRELRFARGARVFAAPLPLLVHVLHAPRLDAVPLTPPSHRGVIYFERSLLPAIDPGVLYGDAPRGVTGPVLLLDAGGAQVALLADRILHDGEEPAAPVSRPSWDALFGG